MSSFFPLREVPAQPRFSSKDTLVVFGEVFDRGYVNGLIDEAQRCGMKIVYSTVGRRDNDGPLRALNAQELAAKPKPFINVPLEAGFDLEKSQNGNTPVDLLKGVKLSQWEEVELDWKQIESSRLKGIEGFRERVKKYLSELAKIVPPTGNIVFAHTMAGGFPRAKVVMPATNRVFKGYDERYYSSEKFWGLDIGQLCEKSFHEVTGETFHHLIDLTSDLRKERKKSGNEVYYLGYGYHGTEVLIGKNYAWQSYSPYLQGWAKLHLEQIARNAHKDGIKACVFNAPEILTNSSSIFLGVEVSLYPLLAALKKEVGSHPQTKELLNKCASLLSEPHSIDKVLAFTDQYLQNPIIKKWSQFDVWPQHNGPEQMKLMRESSSALIEMHKDQKQLITSELSEAVFKSSGRIMLRYLRNPEQPVVWMGHDIIAKTSLAD